MPVQQLAQQNANPNTGGHVTADYLKLTWDNHVKTAPYHSNSNLPILVTVPGEKIAEAYISRRVHTWDGVYFASNDNSVTWDSSVINGKHKIPEKLESTTNFPLMNDKSLDDKSGTNIASINNE